MGQGKMVWLLGASTGGLQAVKEFLSKVPVSRDIAFVYVQHIAEQQIDTLLRMIEKQTGWPTHQAVTGQFIKPGTVTVISPEFETRLSKQGWMLCFNSRWQGHYAPSIDQVAARLALVYKRDCGAIIFTGMGDDGAKGCQTIKDRGGKVWVQDPTDCTAPTMPEAVIQRKSADFMGTAGQLAQKMCMEMEQMEACSQ